MIAVSYDRYGGPEILSIVEADLPAPGPGEVAVALRAASVAPIDWKLRAGLLQRHFQMRFPKIPGRDGAGIVTALGNGVEGIAVGDRVCVMAPPDTQGTYATARICRPSELVPLPEPLSEIEGASLVNAGLSAWICVVETAGVEAGMKILVHGGSGSVGGLIVQLGRHLGASVTATAREANRDYTASLGADAVIAYDREDFSTQRGFDVVFDLVGGATHAKSHAVLKSGGHLVYLIAAPITPMDAPQGVTVTRAMIADRQEPVRAVLALAARGVLRPQIADVLPLREAAEAHRRMEAGAVSRGRLMLDTAAT